MSDMYKCYFIVRFCEIPLLRGAIGYQGAVTKEQLRSDDKLLNYIIDNLFSTVVDATKAPIEVDGVDVVLYLPDLID